MVLDNMVIKNPLKCIYSIKFWQLFWFMFSSQYFATFFSYSYKNFALLNDINDSVLTWAASIGSGFINGCTRLAVGSLHKHLGTKLILAILMIPLTVVSFTCFFAVDSTPLFFFYVLVNYFSIGGIFAALPTAT